MKSSKDIIELKINFSFIAQYHANVLFCFFYVFFITCKTFKNCCARQNFGVLMLTHLLVSHNL